MSSCLSGGARTYSLDLDIVKSPSTSSTRSSHSSSPSSTLSESSNSPLAISTRKPRTPRKRPNQTYTEAAALLSTIYPNIFSAKNLRKLCKHTKSCNDSFDESPDLLPPFPALDNAAFLLYQPVVVPEKTLSRIEPKLAVDYFEKSPCEQSRSPSEHDLVLSPPSQLSGGYDEDYDFDAESILDEEVEGGIDSIMGSLSVASDSSANESFGSSKEALVHGYYGSLMGLGLGGRFDFGFGMKTVVALRRATDDGDWWRVPTVEVQNIVKPKDKSTPEKNKKKKKLDGGREEKVAKGRETTTTATMASPSPSGSEGQKVGRLCLKLSYDKVLDAWSDGSPYSNDFSPESSEAIAKLAQIDLSPEWRQGEENGGLREASVLRYREKRRTRLFSKKIRYKVRKVNADRRPRIQARSVCKKAVALTVD